MVRRLNWRERCGDARDGFTLIELLIVMVLLVLLAGVSLALYGNSVTRGKEAALKEDLFQMRKAIDEYYADKGKYPADLPVAGVGKVPAEHRPRSVHAIRPRRGSRSRLSWTQEIPRPSRESPT